MFSNDISLLWSEKKERNRGYKHIAPTEQGNGNR